MLSIRTQDRMSLLPYDGILSIKKDYSLHAHSLSTVEIHKGYSIVCDKGILGTYSTQKRALEVLDEIQRASVGKIFIFQDPQPNEKQFSYVYNGVVKNEDLTIIPTVYQMPKE